MQLDLLGYDRITRKVLDDLRAQAEARMEEKGGV